MKEKQLLSVNRIYQAEVDKFMQRVNPGSIPKPFTDMFDSQLKRYCVRTRSSSDYFSAFFTKKKCQQSVNLIVNLMI